MTRRLSFDGDNGPQRFSLLRVALLCGGDGKGDRTRETIRKEARLLDALDTVSEAAPSTTGDSDARALNAHGGTLTIQQEDFELLARYVDTCPWLPRAARQAVDLQDWLSASALT